jgi:hypothetical protein
MDDEEIRNTLAALATIQTLLYNKDENAAFFHFGKLYQHLSELLSKNGSIPTS